MIDESKLIEIRQKADIVSIVSEYITVTQKGKNHFAVCPFHDDHNPSMVVSSEKQIFNCFTCHTGGNVFTFVMKYENVTFIEAVKIVAEKVGINLDIKSSNKNEKYKDEYDIMKLTSKFYLNNINTKSGLKAKNYLNNRGITDEIIKEFDIGFSLNEPNSLFNFLHSKNYPNEVLEKIGLIGKNGIDIYDLFRNRIMIPISNLSGQIVGFTGRIFNGEDSAKYINTKETIIFKKGNILFNYYNAKNHIREAKQLIIVEGNMDAIKMSASGIKNVVALMGTALTDEQIRVIKKANSEVILLFDNDNAGYEATIKNGDLLLRKSIVSKVVRLSDVKDPDEYIEKNGVAALLDNIKHPISYIDFKIDYLKQKIDINNSSGLASFIKEILEVISSLDQITKDIILDKISKEYNISKDVLIKKNEVEVRPPQITQKVISPKKDKYKLLADIILYYIASNSKYLRIYKNELNFFKEKDERDLASEIDYFHRNNENAVFADFLTYITHDEKLHEMTISLLNQYDNEELSHSKFIDYINLMNRKIKEEEITNLKLKIKNELDVDKKIKLIEKLTKIKKEV